MITAAYVVGAAMLYAGIGLATALGFVAAGLARVMPQAGSVTLGARLLIIPGATALWPVLLVRWVRA